MKQNVLSLLQKNHPFRQWRKWSIPNTQLTITGYSRSSDKAFFHIPELRCSFDAGLCEGRQVETVFLTHTHNDHAEDIEYMAKKESGVDIYLPLEAVSYTDAYIRAKKELNYMAEIDPAVPITYKLHGAKGGDTFFFGKDDLYQVRIVQCVHKIPCIGFCLSERRKRLKPEYIALKNDFQASGRMADFGQFMAEKRKQGIETQEVYWKPLFAFLGDTDPCVFEREPWLFEYPIIFTECTHLDEEQAERARLNGHTVWSKLKPIVQAHPENTFVLNHFSLRHSDQDVIDFFEKERRLGKLENIVIWAGAESFGGSNT